MNSISHASIEQLLEIKDGQSNAVSEHVRDCDLCQQELLALEEINHQLFVAADQVPDPALWERIKATAENKPASAEVPLELLAAQQANNGGQSLSRAIYTLAASILVTGFIGLYMFANNGGQLTQTQLMQANIQQLMMHSRNMEQALQKVSLQGDLLTATQRTEADRLYWQLAYLDQMIHESNIDSQSDPQRVEVLWNNRVEALRELNQIYYQRKKTLNDSEI